MLAGRSAALPQRATMAPTTPALPSSRMLPAALTAQAPRRESAANSRRAGLTVQVWLVVRPPCCGNLVVTDMWLAAGKTWSMISKPCQRQAEASPNSRHTQCWLRRLGPDQDPDPDVMFTS